MAAEARVVSLQGLRPLWQPDNKATSCMRCDKTFSIIVRRHHCRHCGRVVCSACSPYRTPLPEMAYNNPVRVCEECIALVNADLREEGSSSTGDDAKEERFASAAVRVFENQRRGGGGKFSAGTLLPPADPAPWTTSEGEVLGDALWTLDELKPPEGTEWVDEWTLDPLQPADDEGWAYAFNFVIKSGKEAPPRFTPERKMAHFVRRRAWVRWYG